MEEKGVIFYQSEVKEHATAPFVLLDLSAEWLERVPTYKDQVPAVQQQGQGFNTYWLF
jgi:tryptophanyl-tRNA synthetase